MPDLSVRACLGAALLLATLPALADEAPVPPTRPVAEAAKALPTLAAPPSTAPRQRYLPLIEREAKAKGLPPEVADAVARVESGYNPGAVGGSGERGLMQVMPPTASMLGFKGSAGELAEPETNIKLGVEYLAGAWKLAHGDLCRALMKYRAGHNEERFSPLSIEYCRRAREHLAALGSPLASSALPSANYFPSAAMPVGSPGTFTAQVRRVNGALRRIAPVRTASTSKRFWAAHMARIRAIEARLPWRRGGIMQPG